MVHVVVCPPIAINNMFEPYSPTPFTSTCAPLHVLSPLPVYSCPLPMSSFHICLIHLHMCLISRVPSHTCLFISPLPRLSSLATASFISISHPVHVPLPYLCVPISPLTKSPFLAAALITLQGYTRIRGDYKRLVSLHMEATDDKLLPITPFPSKKVSNLNIKKIKMIVFAFTT